MNSSVPVLLSLPNGLELVLCSQQQVGCAKFILKEINLLFLKKVTIFSFTKNSSQCFVIDEN